jgi:hypothetical protein
MEYNTADDTAPYFETRETLPSNPSSTWTKHWDSITQHRGSTTQDENTWAQTDTDIDTLMEELLSDATDDDADDTWPTWLNEDKLSKISFASSGEDSPVPPCPHARNARRYMEPPTPPSRTPPSTYLVY